MIQVKILDRINLEKAINEWLAEKYNENPDIEIIDIKYALGGPDCVDSAMIIYKK